MGGEPHRLTSADNAIRSKGFQTAKYFVMLPIEEQRVAWFLGLQRILQLPKTYLAPRRRMTVRQKARNNDIDAPCADHVSTSAESAISRRGIPIRRIMGDQPRRWFDPRYNEPRIVGEIQSLVARSPKGLRLPSWSSFIRPQDRLIGQLVGHKPWLSGINPPDAMHRRRPSISSVASGVGSSKRPALLSHDYSDRSLTPSWHHQLTRRSRMLVRSAYPDETSRAFAPIKASPMAATKYGSDLPRDPVNTDRPGNAAAENAISRPAMLHLDGATLGRWVTEHLERTLARPTTGMTSIDPRASLPRSRVAPF